MYLCAMGKEKFTSFTPCFQAFILVVDPDAVSSDNEDEEASQKKDVDTVLQYP